MPTLKAKPHPPPKQKRVKKVPADSNTPKIDTVITPEEEITDELLKRTLEQSEIPEDLITIREPVAKVVEQPQEVCFAK